MVNKICKDCENSINECTCNYRIILDIPKFIRKISLTIFEKKKDEITLLQWLSIFIAELFIKLPSLYTSRTGEEVTDYEDTPYSDHDSARFLGTLIHHELNELLINITVGSYDSAIRGTRDLFEWMIKTLVLMTDRSLVTKENEDKHKPICFNMIKYEIKISTKYGARYYINTCDDSIIKYICSDDKSENNSPKKILRDIYRELSEYVHKSPKLLEEMQQNGSRRFSDSELFDHSFNLIFKSLDIVCYFYILILDIDVYHSDPKRKHSWRKRTKKNFKMAHIPINLMRSTYSLLHSKEWNSNPSTELMNIKDSHP